MKLQPFTVIALLHPKNQVEIVGQGSQEEDQTILIAGPEIVLASDQTQAQSLAGRIIPKEHLNKSARIEVVVRPF